MSSDATRARCRQMPVVRCHQVPDAARCQSPDTSCLMSPPPRPSGGLGEVSRVPVLMSSALISGDVLPPSVLGPPDCDDERRAPAVKSGVPLLSMSPVQRFCSALSFHQRVLQTFTICGPSVVDLSFHRLRPLGHRPRRLQTDASGHGVRRRRRILCSQRRPLTEAVAGPADFGARRAGCGCQAAAVLKYYKF